MNATDVHAYLLTCPVPRSALKEFREDVARGQIKGTCTVIYNRATGTHEGLNTNLQKYWRRIEAAAQQASLWTDAQVSLPTVGQQEAVRLTSICFDDDAVMAFLAARQPVKPKRGRRRIQDEWTPFWIAAIRFAKTEQLNLGKFPTATELVRELHTAMGSTLDEQTIKPFVSIIQKTVVKHSPEKLLKILSGEDPDTDVKDDQGKNT